MRPVSVFKQLLAVVLISNLFVLPFMDAAASAPVSKLPKPSWLLRGIGLGLMRHVPPSTAAPVAAPAPTRATASAPSHAVAGRAVSRMHAAATMFQTSTLSVSVGFADSSSASLNFPTPWQGAPNMVFIGNSAPGMPVNAGAIRLDNTSSAPVTVDSVGVDLQRPTAQFNLWGSFTIPAGGSAILTQTQSGNFDTSAFPIIACGGTLAAGETRIPQITVTVGGTPQVFQDTAHVLDTGGFDLSCRGNESLQWRPVGTTGIGTPGGALALSPTSNSGSGGSPVTTTAQFTDASGSPLANVAVSFTILSGPNVGQTGQNFTNSQGNATFAYSSSAQGVDVLQASITNSSQAVLKSNQATVDWQAASCGGAGSSQTGTPTLTYIGSIGGEFNDTSELAALLVDGAGTPAAGRSLTFSFAGQNFSAVTDATGVARVAITLNSAPGQVPVNVAFAGDSVLPALQASGTITIDRDETLIRYTGNILLGNSSPQPVSAVLLDPQSMSPIANETVTFAVGGVTATAVTNATGVAATTISLGTTQPTGPSSLTVTFAGDQFYKPSVRTIPVTLFFPAGFVVWGGNAGGLTIGQQVNFWGAQWASQVTGGQFDANPSFKGWSGSLVPIQPCQVNATASNLTNSCWSVKPGQSDPPATLPSFIEVVVSTVIVKSGSSIFGNIACGAVVQVSSNPAYGGVPGQPGFGTIAAVDGSCAGVFPPPAAISATQTQPATVLPNQQITISTTANNTSTATAATNVTVSETLDGLTPATVSTNLGTVVAGGNQSTTFQATVPAIPGRQSSESSTAYIQRLSGLDGRLFTASGQVSFSDAQQQNYLPVDVFSQSVLKLPVLTLALTGPPVVAPGSAATYYVTATNIGSAAASSVQINVTLPDGSTGSFPVSSIVPGSSFSQPVNFTPAALAPKGANETTDQYLARLAAADGQTLTTSAIVNWSDANGNAYGDVGQQIFSTRVRVPILSFTGQAPPTLLPDQNATLSFTVNNTGGCTAVNSALRVTNPDNSVASAPAFPLAAGQSATEQTTWRVTPVAPKSASETDAAYLARLTGINNTALNFLTNLSWSDPGGGIFGPTTETVSSTEVLPILTVSLGAPATAQAGNSISYTVTVSNSGGAGSPGPSLTVTLPNGSMQTPTVGAIAPGGTFQTTINYAIPSTQAAGVISAQAVLLWNDAVQNAYGTVSATAQTTVTNPVQFNSLVLAPAIAGPDVTGTSQTLTGTLTSSGTPIANATVQFTVTGANPTSGTAVTNASGVATFSYSGANSGTDTVQATSGTAVSNNATVSWVTPVQNISTSTIFGRFFASDGSGTFDTPPTATPAFTQSFPTINFNPPAGTVPGNTSGVGVNTRPFTDVTTDLNGNFTGTIVAQGNGMQAGVNNLFTFQAVFTGAFTVASAGDVVFNFFDDDGFMVGIGGGATRVSGPLLDAPASGLTPFESLPVVGAFNVATAPVGNTVVVHFPAAGTYPYEVDYSECCGGQEALTMASGKGSSTGVPPTGSLVITPNNPPTLAAGQTQTFTVEAFDASGSPVQNLGVALIIDGANLQQLNSTTNSSGIATFSYSAVNAGTDTLQAIGNISGMDAISNFVTVNWTVPVGGNGGGTGGGTTVFAQQGWIGGPLSGTVVQGQLPITVASGVNLTSGTLEFWPTANPNNVTVLNSNTTGSGTIGTFDATTLANGGYTIQLQAVANGTQQTSVIVVSVIGENKLGRITKTVTDLQVPLSGLPIAITRTYDSLNRNTVGDFGFGWALSINVGLQVDSSFDVTFKLNGKRETFFFTPQPSSFLFPWLLLPSYIPQPGVFGTLTSNGCSGLIRLQGQTVCFPTGNYQPTTYTYTDPTGRIYVFGADGTMKSITDPTGNILSFTASGITGSASGVTVPFVRDSIGRISTITDPNGNVFQYSYDTNGNLASVTKPGVPTPVTYTYTPDHFLLTQTDPQGNRSSATYFPDGRLQSSTDSLGNVTQYSYNLATNTTTTTNPDGGVVIQTNNNFGNPIRITDALNRTTTFTYDGNQDLLTRTDALGHITTYTYDANGNTTSTKNALGNTVTDTYTNIGELIQTVDALNNVSQWQHDGKGHATALSDALGPILSASYDSQGNRTSLTLPNGATSAVTYDAFGNPTTISDHGNFTINNKFDANGHLIAESDAQHGSQIAFQFDALGNTTQVRDPLGHVLNRTFDGSGNLTSTVDQNGNQVTYAYDGNNNLTGTTYADGTTVQNTYDYAGRMLTRKDESGNITAYAYDKAGELTSVTEGSGTPSAATASFAYDAGGRISRVTDELNHVMQLTRDADGRITATQDALGRVTSMTYDGSGHLTSQTVPGGATTKYSYDARGRMTQVLQPDNTKIINTYSSAGLASVTDEAGNTRTFTRDSRTDLSSVTDADGNNVQYVRDPVGNLSAVIDANGNATTYLFDAADRVTKKTFPDGSFEAYTYDGNDNLIVKRLTDGNVNKFTYDQRNRLTGIQYFDGKTVSFLYTPTGQRQSVTTSLGTTQYAYDSLDRLISITEPAGQAITYTYDAANNITSISDPAGTIHNAYDAINRLTQVTDRLGGITSYAYNLAGLVSQRVLPNGVVTKYSYDVRNRLIGVTHSAGTNAPFESFQYTLGPSGKRLSVLEASGTKTTWTYDPAYHLMAEDVTNGSGNPVSTTSYAYDAAGNRTAVTLNGTTTNYRYNTLDQLVNAGAVQYSYDGRGNLIQVNDPTIGITSYTYDAANRMASAGMPTGVTAFYSYDGDGRLVQRTIGGVQHNYFWNEISELGDILFETNMNGQVAAAYTLGQDDLIQQIGNGNAQPSYFLKDGLGSVIGLTSPNGNETDTYRYEAYGNLTQMTGTSTNPYGYRSQRVDDASGLIYLRARYYHLPSGRFTARDKADFLLDNPIDLNRYGYAADDPINNYDPTGQDDAVEEGLILSETEEQTIINAYTVGRADKALISWAADYIAATFAAITIEQAFPYGKRITGAITIAFGFVLDVNIGTVAENAELRALNTPAARKILLGYASEFEADPGGFRFALSGTRKPWKRLIGILGGFGAGDNSLDFGDDQCSSHAERKIANGAGSNTILSIAPSRPVCLTCWNALHPIVDVLGPLGFRWCKQDPNNPANQ